MTIEQEQPLSQQVIYTIVYSRDRDSIVD